jgi:mRNA interferase MazF
MTTSETYDRWDVAVALFPFTEIAQRKPRPIVIISNAAFNQANRHVIAAMITTGAGSHWDGDHDILELAPTGLRRPSLVRWKLFTLPFEVVPRKVGTLGSVDRGLLAAKAAGILLG